MASPGRRPDPALIDALIERPAAFGFFQAVRLLEALGAAGGRAPVGFDHDPSSEAARLRGHASLAFPAGDVRDVRGLAKRDGSSLPELRATFIGFLGAAGVLPQHFTELVVRRHQVKDTSLLDWLDLLLHRSLSLLVRAWRKYRPGFAFEHSRRHPGAEDPTGVVLRSLAGIATGRLADRQAIADDALVYFAGHLSSRRRSAAALAALAGAWLRMPARLREFVGRWLPIEAGDRSLLPSRAAPRGRHACLGRDLVLGARVRDVGSRVRLEVGPLPYPDYLAILPGSAAHRGLRDLVKTFAGIGIDCDLEISFRREELPPARLACRKGSCALGRDAWLGEPARSRQIRREVFPLTAV